MLLQGIGLNSAITNVHEQACPNKTMMPMKLLDRIRRGSFDGIRHKAKGSLAGEFGATPAPLQRLRLHHAQGQQSKEQTICTIHCTICDLCVQKHVQLMLPE